MSDFAKEILPINLEDEMRQSFLDYAMSVIVSRALPDVRDGLKPVHRRILYAMHENNYDWNRAYRKSARVVGDVMGKYHPHGDSAIYDAMVRMAQPFSMRYMLIDGQGNFGSVDGDPAAAMRYTEVRMAKITQELLQNIDEETVDFTPNYDGSESEPNVLPSRIPNLLVNGGTGIAVGMATNIPPHNISEVVNATIAMIDNPSITIEGLMEHLPGPDFPTQGIINGARGIREAYQTQPKLLSLPEVLNAFIRHRREVVTRRTVYRLRKARERAHILEGLAVALANIDPIIQLIKESPDGAVAKAGLVGRTWEPGIVSGMLERAGAEASRPEGIGPEFGLVDGQYQLTEVQAQAILDLRLQRLTGLEQDKIIDEYREILSKIEGFLEILTDSERLRAVIRGELVEIIEQYGDQRRTEIQVDHSEMSAEDLIADEAVVVTLSHGGYAKAQPLSDYRAQRRGGRGKSATAMRCCQENTVVRLQQASYQRHHRHRLARG